MKTNEYKNLTEIKYLNELVTNPPIILGHYSYYSGYYSQDFEDGSVRYLWGDKKTKKLFNPFDYGWNVDQLIIETMFVSQAAQ